MVIDAQEKLSKYSDLAGTALQRDEVIGSALADQVFAVIDAIWLQDARLFKERGKGR